jgi:hypothetical protein
MMEQTCDSDIIIEEKGEGYWIYRKLSSGERWRIDGVCDQRGDCLIGAIVNDPITGDKIQIKDHEHLASLGPRPDSKLDVPVGPGFKGCCPLKGTVV